jgi:hypothetical protein
MFGPPTTAFTSKTSNKAQRLSQDAKDSNSKAVQSQVHRWKNQVLQSAKHLGRVSMRG